MAKTIEDLQDEVKFKENQLATTPEKYASKSFVANLEREIASARKRIQELVENRIRIGDGTVAEIDSVVYGHFELPSLDAKGNVQNYRIYKRTIKQTRKNLAGVGEISFVPKMAGRRVTNWYDARRFFKTEEDAAAGIKTSLEKRVEDARAVLAQAEELISFCDIHDPRIMDLTAEEAEQE